MDNFAQFSHIDDDITITEIEYIYHKKRPSGFTYSKVNRSYYTIAIILAGHAEYDFDDKKYTVRSGDVLFLDKDTKYTTLVTSKENWEHIVISFKVDSDTDIRNLPIKTINKVTHNSRIKELFCQSHEIWSQCAAAYKIQVKAITTQILFELVSENITQLFGSDTIRSSLKIASEYMEQNYMNKISVDTLAKLSGYSPSHFARIFSQVYGVSPIQYLNHIRITHAKNLLKANQHTISQIAKKCGFSNVYYFSRYFKETVGINPKNY